MGAYPNDNYVVAGWTNGESDAGIVCSYVDPLDDGEGSALYGSAPMACEGPDGGHGDGTFGTYVYGADASNGVNDYVTACVAFYHSYPKPPLVD